MGMFDTINLLDGLKAKLSHVTGNESDVQTKDMDLELVDYELGDDLYLRVREEGALDRWEGHEYHDKVKAGIFTGFVSSSLGALNSGYLTFVFINNKLVMIQHQICCNNFLNDASEVTWFIVTDDNTVLQFDNVEQYASYQEAETVYNCLYCYEAHNDENVIGVYKGLKDFLNRLSLDLDLPSIVTQPEIKTTPLEGREQLFNKMDAILIRESLEVAGIEIPVGTSIYNRGDLDDILCTLTKK